MGDNFRNRDLAREWQERDRRMEKLKYHTSVAESDGIKQQHTMDLELWEAMKNGDIDNFITCLEKFCQNNATHLSIIFSQLTVPDQDTFLHVAARYGHEDLAGFIANHYFELLKCRNHKGDSALHLAARAGHFGVVAMLLRVEQAEQKYKYQVDDREIYYNFMNKEELYMKREEERVAINDEGNTALHEAMLYDHKNVALCLIEYNVEAAYYVNKQGKSPLYMAVESSNMEYVSNIFRRRSSYTHLLDEQLIKGKSLLHAAIRNKSTGMPPVYNFATHICKLLCINPVNCAT